MKKFDPFTATHLPNGARILDNVCTRRDGWIWLAYWEGNFMPYVTWRSNKDTPGATYAGNYFTKLDEAVTDFFERNER